MSNMSHTNPKPPVPPTSRPKRPERPTRPNGPRPKAKPRRRGALSLTTFACAALCSFGTGGTHTFRSVQVSHLDSAGLCHDGQCVHFNHGTDHDSFHRHFFI